MSRAGTEVADFYDRWTPEFLDRFGATFQSGLAVTTPGGIESAVESAVYLASRAGVAEGDLILDVGCGVGGPAMSIASRFDVRIEGVTISQVQVDIGTELVRRAGLKGRVRIHLGDYHDLPFEDSHFDRVLMFEAICYSDDISGLTEELARVLKPGGVIYIKDIFSREGEISSRARAGLELYNEIWRCRRTPTIGELVDAMRGAGLRHITTREMHEIGTDHFFASMFDLDGGVLSASDVMKRFLHPLPDLDLLWGEIKAS